MTDIQEPEEASPFDSAHFRQVLGHFSTGITIVTAPGSDGPAGFTAVSFTSVSLEPPLVLVCPQKTSSSWPKIREAGVFCANILSAEQEALCRAFATSGTDKFAGVGWSPSHSTGAPVLQGALAWVDCRIEVEHDAGDHLVVIGRVVDMGVADEGLPLLFYRGGYGRFQA